jgi:hypothetical protein
MNKELKNKTSRRPRPLRRWSVATLVAEAFARPAGDRVPAH